MHVLIDENSEHNYKIKMENKINVSLHMIIGEVKIAKKRTVKTIIYLVITDNKVHDCNFKMFDMPFYWSHSSNVKGN